ncbi:MAG: DUF418 domain-containing protein [Parvularcula sp.]|nr:DUF418 domain-containing protein [Parvularcula sp.]
MSGLEGAPGRSGASDRILYLDVLRGFAVMAIFIVNIKAMTMPLAYYSNPSIWGDPTDQLIAIVQRFVVDDKWRTIFTALYGAGLLMIADRLAARGETRPILRRRNLWLIVFGFAHFFLIWAGDILAIYGMIGLLAMLFVRRKGRGLAMFGLGFLALGTAWAGAFAYLPVVVPEFAAKVAPLVWEPTPEILAEQIAAMQGGFLSQIGLRAEEAVAFYVFWFGFGGMWLITLGLMLCGMALYRSGLLRGAWPWAVTLPLGVVSLGAAFALDGWQIAALQRTDYAFDTQSSATFIAMIDGYLGGFGYACIVSALLSFGLRFGAVAAAGRMAFTNYIFSSLVGTSLAGGHLFGLFGEFSLTMLMVIVALTILTILVVSPLWLNRFGQGPLEALWRRLVYGRSVAKAPIVAG